MGTVQGEGPVNFENRIPTAGVHTPWAKYRDDLYAGDGVSVPTGGVPRKAVLWLCGERRSSEMSELCHLGQSEGYGACDDDTPQ